MASEPRKFFSEAPSRPPQKLHFWEQKACIDSTAYNYKLIVFSDRQ